MRKADRGTKSISGVPVVVVYDKMFIVLTPGVPFTEPVPVRRPLSVSDKPVSPETPDLKNRVTSSPRTGWLKTEVRRNSDLRSNSPVERTLPCREDSQDLVQGYSRVRKSP